MALHSPTRLELGVLDCGNVIVVVPIVVASTSVSIAALQLALACAVLYPESPGSTVFVHALSFQGLSMRRSQCYKECRSRVKFVVLVSKGSCGKWRVATVAAQAASRQPNDRR